MRPAALPLYFGYVALTFAGALLMAIFPLPGDYGILRPELVCLLVIYWVLFTPEHLGISLAFCAGLLQDVVEGTVWGAHAVGLAVVAYICLVSYQRMQNYSVWHQTLWVFVLVGTHQVFVNWLQGLAGYHTPMTYMLVPTVVSALLWPPLSLYLSRFRRRHRLP